MSQQLGQAELQLADRHPLNTIAPYYTMFKPSFPLSELHGGKGWVLDPFCGRGTTLFSARLCGRPSVGIDASPVAAAIASAKLVAVEPTAVVSLARLLIAEGRDYAQRPSGEFWELAFDPGTLHEVCAIRSGLLAMKHHTSESTALRALMLGGLHGPRGKGVQSYFSNQMPRTYATKPSGAVRFWRKHGLTPEYVCVLDVVERRAKRAFGSELPSAPGSVIQGDARHSQPRGVAEPFTQVVTSPPYYGMRTYLTDQWLRLWFLGGPEELDFSQDRQMDMSSPQAFAKDLARVWRSVAGMCADGCRMTIRYGAVPSIKSSPEDLIRESLQAADSCWRIMSVNDGGAASGGRRQAQQFGFVQSKPIQEIDVVAILGG